MADHLLLHGLRLQRVGPAEWEVPQGSRQGMRVPARLFAGDALLQAMDAQVLEQVCNVATLPGILGAAYCMPDGHSGYGFPIGGVAAMAADTGVISPGGIGFDINCGMRLVLTNLTIRDVRPKLRELVDLLYQRVPAGVGSSGILKLGKGEFRKVSELGARWCLDQGMAWPEDLEATELGGLAEGADSGTVSERAVERGHQQVGTLGSGNHYLEVQWVREGDIHDSALAKRWGLFPDQVVVMFHCGSRGFGHQVASDYLETFLKAGKSKYGIDVPDRELACAPFQSPEGQAYFTAMKCGVNMSFANRQVILHRIRECFQRVFHREPEALGLRQLFDVSHNRASLEEHDWQGKRVQVVVHRKGATGCYPPGRPEVPQRFRGDGSPVIVGGSMETGSYLLVGAEGARKAWCSTAHGSGRTMSRTQARRQFRGEALQRDMGQRGIYVRSVSFAGLAEEAGPAYKDIESVVAATDEAGLSRRVARFTPVGNVKG
jgi:tRNA-splicing ligase RtcB